MRASILKVHLMIILYDIFVQMLPVKIPILKRLTTFLKNKSDVV
jgi:hypothetical protein